ncbi:WD40 repeat-like protein [Hortaea werneckii]|nr:WD40 repeat-like protein [Hortaea werneckii]KAI6999540.1 WD40 repeat-like protein [Hortaea werneckii]KAI7142895.1 WD40 repeat-like protein [Hortaea werneckii]KAI7171776.1 WD40 repeat-like protein [Hortaea werneckii]KAI7508078.1 WD40 repeat-like protein [Hortaea werneckii]
MAKPVASSTLGSEPDTYFYSLARTAGTNSLATIGSDDTLRIFDPTTLRNITAARTPGSGLSCLQTFSSDQTLATAGRDGTIRLWDTRSSSSSNNGCKPITQIPEPHGRSFSALANHSHILAAGTESTKEGLGDVSVLLYDTRGNTSVPLREYAESHTDSITQLAFHPGNPACVLSGSTDGLVSLFDGNEADEEEALKVVLNPRSAVHCAGFLSPGEIYVLTTDEQFLIYPLPTGAEADVSGEAGGEGEAGTAVEQDFGDVRGEFDCMYVVNLLRQPGDEQPMIAYGHNEQQRLGVVQLSSSSSSLSGKGGRGQWGFGARVDFPGAHGEEVVRDMLVGGEGRAWSCGEDGCVRVWKW